MFSLIDNYWIMKESTREIFHKESGSLYKEFLDWCLNNDPSYDPEKLEVSFEIQSLPNGYDENGELIITDFRVFSATLKQSYTDQINKINSIKTRKQKIGEGQEVIALMSYLNEERAITVEDSQALLANADVQSAVGALQVGALESAKAVIQAMDISGLVVTESDRTEIIAKLDEFIGV